MTNIHNYTPYGEEDDDSTGQSEVVSTGSFTDMPAQSAHAQSYSESYSKAPAESSDAAYPISSASSASIGGFNNARAQEAVSALIPNAHDDVSESLNPAEDQFTTAFDIIQQLETKVAEAKSGLFSGDQIRLDRNEISDLLKELKEVLPIQLERASSLMREAERRLESAQNQSNSIISAAQSKSATIIKEANEQAQFLAGQENVVNIATEQARNILANAQHKANELTRGANAYSEKSMRALDDQIAEIHDSIVNGLEVLHQRQKLAEQEIPHLSADDYDDYDG